MNKSIQSLTSGGITLNNLVRFLTGRHTIAREAGFVHGNQPTVAMFVSRERCCRSQNLGATERRNAGASSIIAAAQLICGELRRTEVLELTGSGSARKRPGRRSFSFLRLGLLGGHIGLGNISRYLSPALPLHPGIDRGRGFQPGPRNS